MKFAERAWQRPLTKSDRVELVGLYRSLRTKVELSHENAIRDTLMSILMSPRFFFPGNNPQTGSTAATALGFRARKQAEFLSMVQPSG